jgi:hypothetical protein
MSHTENGQGEATGGQRRPNLRELARQQSEAQSATAEKLAEVTARAEQVEAQAAQEREAARRREMIGKTITESVPLIIDLMRAEQQHQAEAWRAQRASEIEAGAERLRAEQAFTKTIIANLITETIKRSGESFTDSVTPALRETAQEATREVVQTEMERMLAWVTKAVNLTLETATKKLAAAAAEQVKAQSGMYESERQVKETLQKASETVPSAIQQAMWRTVAVAVLVLGLAVWGATWWIGREWSMAAEKTARLAATESQLQATQMKFRSLREWAGFMTPEEVKRVQARVDKAAQEKAAQSGRK